MNSITHLPSLKQLRYLVALEEHRHFGKAAAACFVSQSTLSAGLKELESALDAELVERNNRTIVFTALGLEVAQRARRVLREAEELAELAATERAPLTGRLRLGVIPTIAPYLLPKTLPHLRKAYPKLQLYLTEDLTHRLLALLEDGTIDLVLMALPYHAGEVETLPLFKDGFQLVARKDDPLAQKKTVTLGDLEDANLLLLAEGHCLRDHALAACRLPQAESGFAGASLNTLVEMVAGGLGVTLLPDMAVPAHVPKTGELVARPFDRSGAGRQIGLVWRTTSSRGAEFKEFGAALSKAARSAGVAVG
ncbi:MAG TPA: hydrogen peroxide-inducible genes activator [Dongiaceae bacterium]|jgi:LysR family hydrogen peroxide-inducible transcriptional activator